MKLRRALQNYRKFFNRTVAAGVGFVVLAALFIGLDRVSNLENTIWQTGCYLGHAPDCSQLGTAYFKGLGINKDRSKALKFFQLACDGGVSSDCMLMGVAYHYGDGVERDHANAATLYSKSCEGGNTMGCNGLGALAAEYFRGEEVVQNKSFAIELFQVGCFAGDSQACKVLGLIYEEGNGANVDLERAKDFFVRACTADDEEACAYLKQVGRISPVKPE